MKKTEGKIQEYTNEFEDDFSNSRNLKHKKLGKRYKYVHKNFIYWILNIIIYYIVVPFFYIVAKIACGYRIKNKKNLKLVRGSGYFLYANHTSMFDPIVHSLLTFPNQAYQIAGRQVLSVPFVGWLVKMLGAIPLPDTARNKRKFDECLEYRGVKKKHPIIVYPEAHIWKFCTQIRTLRPSTFRFPVTLNLPIMVVTTTWRKPGWLFRKPRMTLTLSEPIYPLDELDDKENHELLALQTKQIMTDIVNRPTNYQYIKYIQKSADI